MDGGVMDPLEMPAAARRRWETGGVRVVKVKVRSGLMVMVVGMGTLGLKWPVLALLFGHIHLGQRYTETRSQPGLQLLAEIHRFHSSCSQCRTDRR